jgi:hypothetical protein
MPLIPMRALVPFTHDGQPIRPGEHVEVGPTAAAVLHYQHKAEFLTIRVQPQEPELAVRKRRTYKRRDLQAEG